MTFSGSYKRRMGLFGAALLALATALTGGCAEEIGRLEMSVLDKPEGGMIASLAILEDEEEAYVFAPSGGQLFTRSANRPGWESHEVSWPDSVLGAGLALFDGMRPAQTSFTFPQNQLFTAHQGMLWTVASPTFRAPMRLLWSPDRGRSWHDAPLPTMVGEGEGVGARAQGARLSRLRLLVTAEDTLFLTDSERVWRLDWSDEVELAPEAWTPISRSGIEFSSAARGASLPPMIRNYLPATEDRPFEVITLVHDQLSVYIRPSEAENWVLTSMVPTVDRQLVEIPGSARLFLVAVDGLYQSDVHGEKWERVPISAHLSRGLTYTSALALTDENAPAGYSLLLGAADGSIWRSIDGGIEWSETLSRDADGRGVMTFAVSKKQGVIWAGTAGRGVLESRDGGESWSIQNMGLTATRILAMAVDGSTGLLVGTEAGLFRQTGDPRSGQWTKLHERGTSSIYRHPENGRLFIGTLGGSIIVQHRDGREFVGEAAALGRVDRIMYQPVHLQNASLPPRAIVDITPRPGSQQIFAWSHQFGPLTSADAGASWRRLGLSEALRTALHGDLITHFKADQDQRLYVVSRPFEPTQPSQLWRSLNNGESWHAVYSFHPGSLQVPMRIGRSFQTPVDMLFMVHGDRLALSRDQGSTWSVTPGGWEGSLIQGATFTRDEIILIAQRSNAGELYVISDIESQARVVKAYNLAWPEGWVSHTDESVQVAYQDRYFFVHNVDTVYAGVLPRRKTRLPAGMSIAISIIGLSAITAISFTFLQKS